MIKESAVSFHSEQQLYQFNALNSFKTVAHAIS
ncbi:MAG: hypothetical protein K0R51_2277, partial [Cytophagaceae bacterium]|nr:hypothetical protein [Cytophagaceae bacterium]